jgi:hypothetical protein
MSKFPIDYMGQILYPTNDILSNITKKGYEMSNNSEPQARGMDLASLFNVATQALSANQSNLNDSDAENHNHGDNMVQVFNTISQVMANNSNASPSEQFSQASQYLAQNGTSGSAHAYSQGLAQAAQQFQGQPAVTQDNAMTLIQSLLGGGGAQQQSSNPLDALLGGGGNSSAGGSDLLGALLGGGQSTQGNQQQSGGDLLGALLGGGGQSSQGSQQQNGLDVGDLLNAGMAFMNAKQQGQSTLQAGLSALIAAGPLGQKPHRQQSGQVVANALLQAFTQNRK